MKRIFMGLLGCCLGAGLLNAQPPDTLWTQLYDWPGSQAVFAASELNDGSLIMAGWTGDADLVRTDAIIIRADSNGDTIWTRTYGDSLSTNFAALKRIGNEGYIAAGTAREAVTHHCQFYAVRLDMDGGVLWTRRIADPNAEDVASDVEPTPDGGFVVCGYSSRTSESVSQIYIVRLTADGDTLWTRFYRQPGPIPYMTGAYDIEPVSEGGFIVAGFKRRFEDERAYVMRIDEIGDTLWTQTLTVQQSFIRKIHETTDGGFIVAGYAFDTSPGTSNALLAKLDPEGTLEWQRTYPLNGQRSSSLADLQLAAAGGYVAVGFVSSSDDPPRDCFYVLRADDSGDTLWTKTIPTVQYGGATSVVQTSDGGFFVAGIVAEFEPNASSVYLVRLSTDPNFVQPRMPASPTSYLSQNYPNPFNPNTEIKFDLPENTHVQLKIFNTLGQHVSTLIDEVRAAGAYQMFWDSKDSRGTSVASGVYIYQLNAGNFVDAKKMVLIR